MHHQLMNKQEPTSTLSASTVGLPEQYGSTLPIVHLQCRASCSSTQMDQCTKNAGTWTQSSEPRPTCHLCWRLLHK